MGLGITVFTGTYNYGKYIHRVYESLKNQTYRNFEWLIVDDASTDDTEDIIRGWQSEENDFPIRYHKQPENRGHMHVQNKGAELAAFPFMVNIDSDDALTADGLQKLAGKWEVLDPEIQKDIGIVFGLCIDQNGKLVGTKFPEDGLVADYYETTFKYRVKGEKCAMYRTQALLEYPFYDKIDKHVIHSATYFDMAEKYKLYCINDIIRVYWVREPGRLTNSDKPKQLRHIKGRQFYAQARINRYFPRIPSLKFKFYTFISYIRYSWHSGIRPGEMMARIEKSGNKIAFLAVLPVGMSVVLVDKVRGRA